VEFNSRHLDQVSMSGVVGNVALEENDAMTVRCECFEQTAEQRCVAVTPRRADCQTKKDDLHLAAKKAQNQGDKTVKSH
jgi:hypothetical protein